MKRLTTIFMFMLLSVMGAMAATDYCLAIKTEGATKVNADGQTVKKDLCDDQISYELSTPLQKGKTYRLTFKVMGTEEVDLAVSAVWNASPNKDEKGNSTDVQAIKTRQVTTSWAGARYTFTAEYDCDELEFQFGGLNGYLFLDNVKLVDTSVGVNMVTNGEFVDNSSKGWSTKTAENGTTFSLMDSGNTDIIAGEPFIPDTWEFAKQGDPNFHVYLAFGQSNMEGAATPEAEDKQNVPERFKMMAAVDFNSPSRKMGNWYTAVPPLCRQGTGLTPCDYFGRYLVENLPEEVQVGVINVAVGGARIELFMEEYKDEYIEGEADWFKNYCKQYNNDPLGRLIEMGKKAQQKGVIKGILLHQGESNNGAKDWAGKVAKIYKRICYRLGLNPEEVPLLAGETLYENMGGGCAWHNASAMPMLKDAIPNSYVISAENIPGNGKDAWHFSAAGYREFGKRYGEQMLEILKQQETAVKAPYLNAINSDKCYNINGVEIGKNQKKGLIIENGVKKIVK